MALLEVNDLTVKFYTEDGVVTAVDDLSYRIERGEKFGVVGESGAGKSVTALSLMRLIESPGQIESGEILFKGEDVLEMTEREVRDIRGNEMAMIFQDAQTALNPVYTVGEQISEAIRHHLGYDDAEACERAIQLLDRVGIPEAEARYSDYPHEFSGGMQQRAVIAMALSCDPDLLLCDEPTTALDVTIEAQILDELEELADEFDTAIQLITHDLGVVAEVCDRVMVMYAGKPVEKAPVEELYYDPKHPYTVGLMSSIPRIGTERDRLQTIPGTMPDLVELPPGCSFHPRCPFAEEACTRKEPPLLDPETGEPATDSSTERAAACLEYAGELVDGLDYTVEVRDEAAGEGADGGAGTGTETEAVPGAGSTTTRTDTPANSDGDRDA
ncbi:ABC transporter ATP-binding protein [Halopiger thermotolerans]